MIHLLNSNALHIPLADNSVQCVITSPPYWGLRDYGTARWEGGDPDCDHVAERSVKREMHQTHASGRGSIDTEMHVSEFPKGDCIKCGARRVDAQIGLEATPAEYVAHIVAVMRECWRVLRDDGTLWLNLGDSYMSNGQSQNAPGGDVGQRGMRQGNAIIPPKVDGLKPKDLCGIPWLVAKALQKPFYTGRIAEEKDRVWLAAIIDAEGTICGFTHQRKDDGSIRTGVHVAITNSNRKLLDEAHRIWPASLSDHGHPGDGHIGKMETWRWIAHNVDDKSILMREMYPYLIAKKKQALLAYNLFEISKDAKRLGKSGEAKSTHEKRALIVNLISKLNHLEDVDIPDWCIEPPSLYEPGWYLRSDIIWAKPNPMPESVTDRPTKAHEYIFLLTKQARYHYDAEAIKEPLLTDYSKIDAWSNKPGYSGNPNVTGEKGHALPVNGNARNRRSVWTVATQPYSGAKGLADYVGDDGKPYKASPDCPIHGHLARERTSYTVGYDARLDQNQSRNSGNGNGHEQAPVSLQSAMTSRNSQDERGENVQQQNPESIDDYRSEASRPEYTAPVQTVDRTNRKSMSDEPLGHTLDSRHREYSLPANGHNKRKSKTARVRRTSQHDTASEETHDHIQSMLPIDEHPDLDGRIDVNNNGEDYASNEMQIDPSVQRVSRIARIDSSFDTSHMRLYCTCEVVSTDHFATFPPALVEPMILAGTRRGDVVLDPFAGTATVGRVAIKHGRRFVGLDLNTAYIELALARTSKVQTVMPL